MIKLPWAKKSLLKILSALIIFLTWFIRLDIFIGDVTIWLVKTTLLTIGRLLKRLNLDLRKKAPAVFHTLDKIIHHPITSQDRSFKVGLATIFILIFAIWFTTRDLPSPKQLETVVDKHTQQSVVRRVLKQFFSVSTLHQHYYAPTSESTLPKL